MPGNLAAFRAMIARWKARARALKVESYALFLAARDPRVPWHARIFIACVVAYALSPIDLIPDFVPVLGYLDDLVIIPLGVVMALRMIPPAIMEQHRLEAERLFRDKRPRSWIGAMIVVAIWLAVAAWLAIALWG